MLAAIILLLTDLLLGVVNVFVISTGGRPWEVLLLPFYVLFLIAIRGIGSGANWARIAYLLLLIPGAFGVNLAVEELPRLQDDLAQWKAWLADPKPDTSSFVDNDGMTVIECHVCALQPPDWVKWSMASHIVTICRGTLLAAGLLLLFTPGANRWFRTSRHRGD